MRHRYRPVDDTPRRVAYFRDRACLMIYSNP